MRGGVRKVKGMVVLGLVALSSMGVLASKPPVERKGPPRHVYDIKSKEAGGGYQHTSDNGDGLGWGDELVADEAWFSDDVLIGGHVSYRSSAKTYYTYGVDLGYRFTPNIGYDFTFTRLQKERFADVMTHRHFYTAGVVVAHEIVGKLSASLGAGAAFRMLRETNNHSTTYLSYYAAAGLSYALIDAASIQINYHYLPRLADVNAGRQESLYSAGIVFRL